MTPEYHAIIKPLASLGRVYLAGNGDGDPYEWHISIVHVDATTVVLQGTQEAPTKEQYAALLAQMKADGIEKVTYEHVRGGLMCENRRQLAPGNQQQRTETNKGTL